MSKDWTDFEVRTIIEDYFKMLSLEINQIPFKKSDHRRVLKGKLNNRSDGSIEFKHQNISAVLIKYGRPYIIGYKPRSNYQGRLEVEILKFLESDIEMQDDFDLFASADNSNNLDKVNFKNWIIEKPKEIDIKEPKPRYKTKISKVNYLEKEQKNRVLGLQGEELVVEYEKWRLIKNGKTSLTDKIEWVSKEYGDGAGFDILSKNSNGTDRYIEVKTTKLGILTPIYLTRNELFFSEKNEQNYHMYRVFEFNKSPKMFNSQGSLDKVCQIEPVSYIGRFK